MTKYKVAVVGLGYVGLPVAVAFGEKNPTIGFDINESRLEELRQGFDRTKEVSEEQLQQASIHYTSDPRDLKRANFIIVAVPTPITENRYPDLTPLKQASTMIGKHLSKGTIVV